MSEELLCSPLCSSLILGMLAILGAALITKLQERGKPKRDRKDLHASLSDADLDELIVLGILDDMFGRDRRE